MSDFSTGAMRSFSFTAREGDWRELIRQLNEFAKMVATDLYTERLTTKGIIPVPIDGPKTKAEAPLGLLFCRKANFASENPSHPVTTAIHLVGENPDPAYGRQLYRIQMQTPTYDGVNGGLR